MRRGGVVKVDRAAREAAEAVRAEARRVEFADLQEADAARQRRATLATVLGVTVLVGSVVVLGVSLDTGPDAFSPSSGPTSTTIEAAAGVTGSSATTTATTAEFADTPDSQAGTETTEILEDIPTGGVDTEALALGPLEPRGGHTVTWTGTEMIVWGGWSDEIGSTRFRDGAAFDPEDDSWRMIAEAPLDGRHNHLAAWTGEAMLILGGDGSTDGALYDPRQDNWTLITPSPVPITGDPVDQVTSAVWTGSRYVIWHVPTDAVAVFDPSRDQWAVLPGTGLNATSGVLRFNGRNVVAFGVASSLPDRVPLLGVELLDGSWSALPQAELWTEQYNLPATPKLTAWFGDRFAAWTDSGRDGPLLELYPGGSTWTTASSLTIPACEGNGSPVNVESATLVLSWCGDDEVVYHETGQREPVVVDGYGDSRDTIWTGEEFLSWGNTCCYGTGEPFMVSTWRLSVDVSR